MTTEKTVNPDDVREYLMRDDHFCVKNNMKLTVVRSDYAEAVLPITPDTFNGVGVVQGGAIFTLADFAFAGASNSQGRTCVAANANISFVRPGTGTELKAVAKIIHSGRKTCLADIEVFNDQEKLVAKITSTGFYLEK